MIKIDKIKPLNTSEVIDLTELEECYLKQVKLDTFPVNIIDRLLDGESVKINGDDRKISNYDGAEKDYLEKIRYRFDEIILCKPENFQKLIKDFDKDLINRGYVKEKFILSEFGKDILHIFGYDNYFRSMPKKGIWLAEKLNIKTCPYCNAQYTLAVNKDSKSSQAKFQFDHFYSKKRYPYLSISLYNLIPSCANCNLAKGDKEYTLEDHFHPYYNSLAERAKFDVDYELDLDALSTGDTSEIDPTVTLKEKFESYERFVSEHNKIYNIEGIYARFSDEVRRLLNMAIVTDKEYESLSQIEGLFPDKAIYLHYLLGNYPYEEDINEKPLAKFTQDLARKWGII